MEYFDSSYNAYLSLFSVIIDAKRHKRHGGHSSAFGIFLRLSRTGRIRNLNAAKSILVTEQDRLTHSVLYCKAKIKDTPPPVSPIL